MTHGRHMSVDAANITSPVTAQGSSSNQAANDKPDSPAPVLNRGLTDSPTPATPPPAATTTNVATTSVGASPAADVRPSAQSVRSSTSIDRAAGATSPMSQNQARPATSLSSHSHTTPKLETASNSAATDKSTPSVGKNNSLTTSPTAAEPLVSPYSPVPKPVGLALTESTSSDRPKSPTASILTSPYSHHDHAQADRMSILTSPHSVYELQERASGESRGLAQAGANLRAASTVRPTPGQPLSPTNAGKKPATHEPEDNFLNEAGALYFMHQSRLEGGGGTTGLSNKPRQVPMPTTSDEDEDEDSGSSGEYTKPSDKGPNAGGYLDTTGSTLTGELTS